jgi:hypothetical protein
MASDVDTARAVLSSVRAMASGVQWRHRSAAALAHT